MSILIIFVIYFCNTLAAYHETRTELTAVGFFDGETPPAFLQLAAALRTQGFAFGAVTDQAVATHFKITAFPAMLVFKKFDDPVVVYAGAFAHYEMSKFLNEEAFPLVGEITPKSFGRYSQRNVPIYYIFIDPQNKEQQVLLLSLLLAFNGCFILSSSFSLQLFMYLFI